MLDPLPDRPVKGRGAVSNRSGRYETYQRQLEDDGWDHEDDELPARPATTVLSDATRKVIAHNQSPDVPFDSSINPYRGCEHGCVYCFARPTHAWLGLSPGLDFETKLFAKHDAAEVLERELSHASYQPEPIAIGANTDPYQPIERRLRITRSLLEVFWRTRHPLVIITKSALVMRDLDILGPMAEAGLATVYVSVTTLDNKLARRLEPRAPRPDRRLAAINALHRAGVPVGVLAAPMIPALNDQELEDILTQAAEAGAGSAGYVLLRLPLEIKDLFIEWLETHYPDRKNHVLNLVRETRGGKLYEAEWGRRLKGSGVYARLLSRRFELACHKLNLERRSDDLDCSLFRKPGRDSKQLALF